MVSIILRGGIGNNLYMMAAAFAHALKNGYEYAIPLEVENPHYVGQKPYVFSGINYVEKLPTFPLYREPSFDFNPIPAIDNIILDGYFQSEKYWSFCKEELLKAFGFHWEFKKDWCALHVRRGDYLKLPDYHPFVGGEYLSAAVKRMNEEKGITKFRVFSNDIPWCKEFFAGTPEYEFEFVEGNNEMQDLEQGSYCEHQILSNGTFALWQYYLNQNPNKVCIAPERWFGRFLSHDTKDLYPENAIIIDNSNDKIQ